MWLHEEDASAGCGEWWVWVGGFLVRCEGVEWRAAVLLGN